MEDQFFSRSDEECEVFTLKISLVNLTVGPSALIRKCGSPLDKASLLKTLKKNTMARWSHKDFDLRFFLQFLNRPSLLMSYCVCQKNNSMLVEPFYTEGIQYNDTKVVHLCNNVPSTALALYKCKKKGFGSIVGTILLNENWIKENYDITVIYPGEYRIIEPQVNYFWYSSGYAYVSLKYSKSLPPASISAKSNTASSSRTSNMIQSENSWGLNASATVGLLRSYHSSPTTTIVEEASQSQSSSRKRETYTNRQQHISIRSETPDNFNESDLSTASLLLKQEPNCSDSVPGKSRKTLLKKPKIERTSSSTESSKTVVKKPKIKKENVTGEAPSVIGKNNLYSDSESKKNEIEEKQLKAKKRELEKERRKMKTLQADYKRTLQSMRENIKTLEKDIKLLQNNIEIRKVEMRKNQLEEKKAKLEQQHC